MLRFISSTLLCLFCLVSCDRVGPRADLIFIQSAEPETLDPTLVSDQVSMRLSSSLFEGLCRFDENGRSQPAMAEWWQVSEDRKTFVFHLREGVKWSDGRPVTAQDFAASWIRALRSETGSDYASLLHVIRGGKDFTEGKLTDPSSVGVRVIDSRTLEVVLENPAPYFLDLCAIQTLAPVPMHVVARHGTAWIKPGNIVSNGAYLLEAWRIDDRIRLRKNPAYWDAANVKMTTVEAWPVPDANTALNLFHSGQCDLMMDKGMTPPTLAAPLKRQPWFHTGPFLGTWFIRMNTTRAPFTDPRVRRAFALAVDKQRLVQNITQLGEKPARGITPPGTGQNYQPPAGLDYDPAQARALLAEAGFPKGRGFPLVEFLHLPMPLERNLAVELQAMWQNNLGVAVNLKKQEQKIWLSSMRDLDYDLCRSSWVGDYNDPSTFLDMFLAESGNNRTGWKNPAYDNHLAEAAGKSDLVRRNEIFSLAEKTLIHDEAVVIPIYHYVGVQFYHAGKLIGVSPNLIDDHPFRCMSWR